MLSAKQLAHTHAPYTPKLHAHAERVIVRAHARACAHDVTYTSCQAQSHCNAVHHARFEPKGQKSIGHTLTLSLYTHGNIAGLAFCSPHQ